MNGESDCHTLWQLDIKAIGVPGAKNFKKEYKDLFQRFEKVYIHSEGDAGAESFIEQICKVLPYEKLYIINSREVDGISKDPSELYINGNFDFIKLIDTAKPVNRELYDNINKIEEDEHVVIAHRVCEKLEIKYYNENFYVYENGVYVQNLPLIEETILSINPNIKKSQRSEVLEYIRISKNVKEIEVNTHFINFKNGLFDLDTEQLIEHTPKYFTTCQLNVNFISDNELVENNYIKSFMRDITSNNEQDEMTLYQISGYCMTSKTNFQKAFILYRTISSKWKKYIY